MGMTIAEALTHIREDLLDDANSIRWTDAQLRRHIKSALSKCQTLYVANGGHRFTRTLTSQSVTSSGLDIVTALGSVVPVEITAVMRADTNYREPIEYIPWHAALLYATETYTVDVQVVPLLEHDTTAATSEALVAAVTDAPGTWDAFEEWVCARAAMEAARKDKDRYRDLEWMVRDAAEAVYGMLPEAPTAALSDLPGGHSYLRWTYENEVLKLVRYS